MKEGRRIICSCRAEGRWGGEGERKRVTNVGSPPWHQLRSLSEREEDGSSWCLLSLHYDPSSVLRASKWINPFKPHDDAVRKQRNLMEVTPLTSKWQSWHLNSGLAGSRVRWHCQPWVRGCLWHLPVIYEILPLESKLHEIHFYSLDRA